MKLKRKIAGALVAIFTIGTAAAASAAWYSATVTIPKLGGAWYTVTRSASGATQQTKVTYAGGNYALISRIVDQNHYNLSSESPSMTVGVTYNLKSGANKGKPIAAKFRTSYTTPVNVQATVAWQP